ncbi:lysophospholipid acyltransferase family protein [Thiohalobacter sp. IOR34]|uniref:lysophospholipid acyltransferase family protein n=1 Tax=Thiohalobacter sp. IOR34 TaxID=3057176 RepID=UPI0025AF9F46|nr:lysophospholipid acyltransferase family protein [Thiohalobacter sp. IOR34]WJW75630.1 lysophospholipid acyltransferase family protein [Thiohalobacter sp. IOR34]
MRARLVKGLIWLTSRLPLRIDHALGAALGWCLAVLPTPLRRISAINLGLCLPEHSPEERRRLLRRSLMETGKAALETGPLWTWPAERLFPLIREVHGAEAVDAALAAGGGVIVATPHLGSWEMAGLYCAERWGITSLYRPPRLRALEALTRAGREHLGARLVPTDAGGIRSLFATLRGGGVVGILPDQDPGASGGVFAPFFGVPANSMLLLSRLARKTGAAVVFTYCERLPRARGYRMHFLPAAAGIDDADPLTAASALNRSVEQCVRALPEQYQWSYRRFRSRPPGEAPLY